MGPSHPNIVDLKMTLSLSQQARQKLDEQAAEIGQNIGDVISDLVERSVASAESSGISYQAWLSQFNEWIASRSGIDRVADDGRESIYIGRDQ